MNNKEIARRLNALEAAFPTLPTFSEFSEQWKNMDELSKSLYQTALSCPELAGESGRRWEVISGYMRQMGINPQPFDFNELVENLESDP